MPQSHPFATYQRTNVNTADQRQLIVMLYDGLLRFLNKARQRIQANDIEGAHNYLVRSREIVAELIATLRPEKGGDIGQNLKRLYAYAFDRIVQANLFKDEAMVEEVIRIMSILREGWISMKSVQAPENVDRIPERKRVRLTT